MFEKILCPIDFSSSSKHAMRVAIRLAKEHDAELVLCHSWQVPALAFSELPVSTSLIDGMVEEETALLAAALAEAKQQGATKARSAFLTGIAWETICAAVDADAAFDLIVMATHGRTGFRRVLLGSVTEKVIRHAPCSVLAVRGRDGLSPFRNILCPIDFSTSSHDAMLLAAELVAPDGGITLLHVLELPVRYSGEPTALDFTSDLDRRAARLLDEWASELRAKVTVPVITRTRIGSPAAQALTVLDHEVSFDLAVVGSHGRTGLGRILLGSAAEKITRHSPCPVLVARRRATKTE